MNEHEDPSDFDRVVEQQDQEFARDGQVSPVTQQRLHAEAHGEPLPSVWDSPAVQRSTARLLRSLHRLQGRASDEEEDAWWDDEEEAETERRPQG